MATSAVPERESRIAPQDLFESGGRLNTAELLFGGGVAAAVLPVTSQPGKTAWAIVSGVLGTLAVYWLVHVYTRVLSERVAEPSARRLSVARHAFFHESAVLLGGL